MATEKPRFSITIDSETLEQVEDYRHKNRIKTQSKAIIDLVRSGLNELENELKSNGLSNSAQKMAEDYDKLDSHGRAAVRGLMDEELNRMEEEKKFGSWNINREPKVINLYCEPSAAGIATPVEGKDYEEYELADDEPQGAAYAVRIQGDSMEPYFPNGSIVFVNHDAIRDGDIGIFCVDGGTVCKQYYKRAGIVYLFSLNRQRDDADVVLAPGSNRTFVCQGRVITRRRYPLPHEL